MEDVDFEVEVEVEVEVDVDFVGADSLFSRALFAVARGFCGRFSVGLCGSVFAVVAVAVARLLRGPWIVIQRARLRPKDSSRIYLASARTSCGGKQNDDQIIVC